MEFEPITNMAGEAVYLHLGLALGVGFLVGLQRERSDKPLGGVRTYTLITLLGALTAIASNFFGLWLAAAGLLGLVLLMAADTAAHISAGKERQSLISEIAAMTMFLVGAAIGAGYTAPAVVVGGSVAILLHWKRPLHEFIETMDEAEVHALMRMALIGLVILPILPDRSYGPYDVLNPYRIWLMVVLIVGISFGAYLVHRILGPRVGAILGGILGGLISSTATTVSYARRTHNRPDEVPMAATVILIASTVVFARVFVEIAIVSPPLLATMGPPLAAMAGFLIVLTVAYIFAVRGSISVPAENGPPKSLTAAIVFGLLYGLILLATAVAQEKFGDRGLYIVAGISGLTDMDAITLSTARMASDGAVDSTLAWRMILTGALSNLIFKGGAVMLVGHRRLGAHVVCLFALACGAGATLMIWWPDAG